MSSNDLNRSICTHHVLFLVFYFFGTVHNHVCNHNVSHIMIGLPLMEYGAQCFAWHEIFFFCHIILEEGSILQQNLNSCNNMITKPFSLPHLQYISYLNDTKQVWYMKLWSVGQCHQLEIFSKWSLTHYDWFATSQPICTGALYYIIVFWFISCHHNLHEDKGFID